MSPLKGKALVTGGAGFIGSHLVDLLLGRGYEVTLLDNLEVETHPQGKPSWLPREARLIQGDLRNDADIVRALEGVRWVFHLAAFGGFTSETAKYLEVNAGGTARLFNQIAMGKFSVEKVVVASSQAVYGEGAYRCDRHGAVFPDARSFSDLQKKRWELSCSQCNGGLKPALTSEEKPRAGETPYALSKEFEERLALSLGKQMKLPVVALRYGVTYGPRQSLFNPYTGVVSIFATQIANRLSPIVYEDGRQTRDFVYVQDVAEASLFVMENPKADFQVFNVGTGKAVAVETLACEVAGALGQKQGPGIRGEFRWGDVRHLVLNPAKLSQLGFQAQTPLAKGLRSFAEWFRSQGPVRENFSEAYKRLKRERIIHG